MVAAAVGVKCVLSVIGRGQNLDRLAAERDAVVGAQPAADCGCLAVADDRASLADNVREQDHADELDPLDPDDAPMAPHLD